MIALSSFIFLTIADLYFPLSEEVFFPLSKGGGKKADSALTNSPLSLYFMCNIS